MHFFVSILSAFLYFCAAFQKYSRCPNSPSRWEKAPSPCLGIFPCLILSAVRRTFSPAAATICLFSFSGLISVFTSATESGIRICTPPVTTAPYFFSRRAATPVPSPENKPMVAMRNTCFPRQHSRFCSIKTRTISGRLLYWIG